ncbi:hypothetical protein EIN_035710 [Entamoeba invadens IP1]|uniref:Leucine rich repeat containing protein BspA family protein n=1 Tax=Entamoeba invadens IP1 TaxID=370355 RepID=A0A0A1U1A6_ENTIV|nr:hypothetical protein EIN_035710 [Entamoeba invadens IP1]ELP86314.1 hypothetical protein EIN_035710 [Entamoeba invadens IP1]|eukprot:XP_004185660.1 hypothetical protein EIN_035710 [Entamoeba invadens IP1]
MSKIDLFNILTVAKYFLSISDFIILSQVNSKYLKIFDCFHFNPFPLSATTRKFFTNLETLHLWSTTDETFGNRVPKRYIEETEQFPDTPQHSSEEHNSDEELELHDEFKKEQRTTETFFNIVIWYQVDFKTTTIYRTNNMVFKNVTYTTKDVKEFGTTIPDIVNTLGEFTFTLQNTTKEQMKDFKIPSHITSIRNECFKGNTNLSQLSFGPNLLSIGESAFVNINNLHIDINSKNCVHLTRITLPESVKVLGMSSFCECGGIEEITIPEGITEIPAWCFGKCFSLRIVSLPKSVERIGQFAFFWCRSLLIFNGGDSLENVGAFCFKDCYSLKSASFRNKNLKVDIGAFFNCNKMKRLEVNENVITNNWELPKCTKVVVI